MKKLTSILLVLLMLTTLLASCGEEKKPASTSASTKKPTTSTTIPGKEEKDFSYIDEYVSSLSTGHTYNGATFTIVGREERGFPKDEELTGDPENDALFNRQKDLEAAFNITISNENVDPGDNDGAGAPTAEKVFQSVSSGLNTYDLVEGNLMTCGQVMLNQKAIRPVDDMEGFDFERSWWLNDIQGQLGINGRLFFLTGKIADSFYGSPGAILFNKKLVLDYDIEDPYALVKSGEWTFDKMAEVASKIPASSGVYRYMMSTQDGLGFFEGGGFTVSARDADGKPVVPDSLSSEATAYIEKLAGVFGDTSITYNFALPEKYGYTSSNDMSSSYEPEDIFTDNKILFWSTGMGTASDMREKDVEFGIIPVPKSDASQENYIGFESAWGVSGFFVPYNLNDEEMVGYVTEAMAALSEKYLEPTYYDRALVKGSVYDQESKEMLDIIYHSGVIDLADTYQWGTSGQPVVKLIDNNAIGFSANLASAYGGNARIANRNISLLLKLVEGYK